MKLLPATDEDAFNDFAVAMAPRLFRSALLMTGGDWHLAEDLVQSTLAKVYVGWRKVDKADSSEAYARGMLTKTFLSHNRVRRNAELPGLELVPELADTGAHASQRVELFEALRTLDPLDRAVVVLRYWEDRSVDDTARAVGMTTGAVRTRASRALARLRVQLTDSTAAGS